MSILKYSPARLRRRSALLLVAALLFVVPCIAAAPFAVHVAIHQPATAAALGQAGVAKIASVSQSNEVQPAAPETVKLLTPDGEEVPLTVVQRPQVGDVVRAGGHRMKIVSIDPQGQYEAYVLKNATGYAFTGESGAQKQTDAYALKKTRLQAELQERAERAGGEKDHGELTEQELQVRREKENVERAARAQHQVELARQAKITMDQAIQTALRDSPGTVMEARLVGERGVPTYVVAILQQNGTENTTARLLINAVDGSIITSDKWGQER